MKTVIADINKARLKEVLVRDKQTSPRKILTLLNSDIRSACENFLDMPDSSVFSSVDITENGLEFSVKKRRHLRVQHLIVAN